MPRVHALLQGHKTNIGDSVLRRAYVEALSTISDDISVWAGPPTTGYVEGLGLNRQAVAQPNFFAWYFNALIDSLRGGAILALNAGQYGLAPRYLVQALLFIPLCVLIRLRKGNIVWLGAAVPAPVKGRTWTIQTLDKLATAVCWRDSTTQTFMPSKARMPDWAFALGPTHPEERPRNLLVVSLRGDRPAPSREWLDSVRTAAQRLDLDVATVTQVDEDHQRNATIAQYLGGHHYGWQSDSHPAQEAIVRSVYSRTAVALSDRLHVLIMAATEGAVPLAWLSLTTDKIPRHLDHLGFKWTSTLPCGVTTPTQALQDLDSSMMEHFSKSTAINVRRARSQLRSQTVWLDFRRGRNPA